MVLILNPCGGTKKEEMESMDLSARKLSISLMTKPYTRNGTFVSIQ